MAVVPDPAPGVQTALESGDKNQDRDVPVHGSRGWLMVSSVGQANDRQL